MTAQDRHKLLRLAGVLLVVGTYLLASAVVRAGPITLENVLLEVGEALISAVVISFVIGVAIARAESRRAEEDAQRAEVHKPRSACPLDVHNSIKGAQLRLAANATVRTYGIEVREVIICARAAISRVTSDIGRSSLLSPDTMGRCVPHR